VPPSLQSRSKAPKNWLSDILCVCVWLHMLYPCPCFSGGWVMLTLRTNTGCGCVCVCARLGCCASNKCDPAVSDIALQLESHHEKLTAPSAKAAWLPPFLARWAETGQMRPSNSNASSIWSHVMSIMLRGYYIYICVCIYIYIHITSYYYYICMHTYNIHLCNCNIRIILIL